MSVYRSTRSSAEQQVSFEDAVITGLAKDGGLFIPSEIPSVPTDFLSAWKDLSFQDLAFKIMRLYIKEAEIPDNDLKDLVERSYSTFRSEEVTPTVKLDSHDNLFLLELFHGPTYAFKDVALQFVGNLFEYFLQRKNKGKAEDDPTRDTITVVGATSGDTGSAAIYGLRNKKDVSVFILYPTGRISPIQELQMTTVVDDNIHTLSVNGTFDDCQALVKEVFNDSEFNDKWHIGAINSINWARILAQITYYFYSYLQVSQAVGHGRVKFIVPSGNFGDILAGFYASQMGLPVEKLVVATNENDILNRFLTTGKYDKGDVKPTHSPAMDIVVSSNFERFLWYMIKETIGKNDEKATGEILNNYMKELSTKGVFTVPQAVLDKATSILDSDRITNEETVSTIKKIYEATSNNYIIDPHTSVGIATTLNQIKKDNDPSITYVSLSTAHPAKFSEVVDAALTSYPDYSFEKDVLPEELKNLSTLPKKIKLIETATLESIKDTIVKTLS
ncbi:Threonine synthase [Komagataella phaffii CBS 7435]|uniref:threonine synthase n=2 Tax=Komagataella phaffii TaxID=460519 RepID=C4R057_KOMPG|nr:Threonine synthase, conserved protein that catalyzes formation of threonine from 0-phosphohomoserine [Komagataella phaffii GS115]AOA62800.1 GQ67_00300T0 [Komagataella phaffii]CAH2448616.1 Threonine synthase [Komagataella phaffii CBS 7435]AOA67765.1 GQ68_01089T0 [Komagataella phaffii GS115]CAY68881.1 Threonine synthase, conserved protein that catalyzes formation of threonine from 0-phosphohomoserine [Komagataella phaffii GS115]CCA38715.1 Threonine synthase [Komagataella phaffii CBS 7435]